MSSLDPFIKVFGKVGFYGVGILNFLFQQHIFKIIGFIAFASTIFEGVTLAMAAYTDPKLIILHSILNIGKIILFIDNSLYLLSKEFMSIQSPGIIEILKYLYLSMKNIYFYIWWYWLADKLFRNAGNMLGTGTDQSTGNIDMAVKVILPRYIIFFTIMNFIGMFATGVISFAMPENLNLIEKFIFLLNSNFETPFDFIFKLVPFKGLIHFTLFSLGRMITILFSPGMTENIPTTVNTT